MFGEGTYLDQGARYSIQYTYLEDPPRAGRGSLAFIYMVYNNNNEFHFFFTSANKKYLGSYSWHDNSYSFGHVYSLLFIIKLRQFKKKIKVYIPSS